MSKLDSIVQELENRSNSIKSAVKSLSEIKKAESDLLQAISDNKKYFEKKETNAVEIVAPPAKKEPLNEEKFMLEKKLMMSESLIGKDVRISTRIVEKRVDEANRTVVAGILEGDSLSLNKRFYPLSVVESVKDTLIGKKSLIGHDTDSPEDIIATITASGMSGKRLVGSFKFGTDEKSEMMFRKVKEGLVDSLSIRASGEMKPGKVNNEDVDIVQKLEIHTVDFVVEGGVESAKVMQVFEQAPTIVYDKETNKEINKMTEQEKQALENKLAESQKREEASVAEIKKLSEEKARLESEKKAEEVKSYKAEKLSTIEDKEVRESIAQNLSGQTKEEVDASFAKLKAMAEGIIKKAGAKIILQPIDENGDTKKFKDVNEILSSPSVEKEEKKEILSALMNGAVIK